jgi:alanine dehydrogenase
MTGVVGRTATHAVSIAAWPYIREIADNGLEAALAADRALARGVKTMNGKIVHPSLAAAYATRPLTNEGVR